MGFTGVALITGILLTGLLLAVVQVIQLGPFKFYDAFVFSFITCMLLLCCIYQRRDIIIVYISAYADNCIKAINFEICMFVVVL